ERMAGGADMRRINSAAKAFVVEHCTDDRAEIDGSQPPKRKTLDRVILQCVVAGMVDRDGDEAVRRECRAEPCKPRRHATATVGQENERASGPRRGRHIARGATGADERDYGWPNPLRFLARVSCGRVPDHRAEGVCLGTAPIVRLSWDKISRGDADPEDSVGPRNIYRNEEDQCCRQKPHPTRPRWFILTC